MSPNDEEITVVSRDGSVVDEILSFFGGGRTILLFKSRLLFFFVMFFFLSPKVKIKNDRWKIKNSNFDGKLRERNYTEKNPESYFLRKKGELARFFTASISEFSFAARAKGFALFVRREQPP